MTTAKPPIDRSTLLTISHLTVNLGLLFWSIAQVSFLHECVHSLAHKNHRYVLFEQIFDDGTPLIYALPMLILATAAVFYRCETRIAKTDLVTGLTRGYAHAIIFTSGLFTLLAFLMRNTGEPMLRETCQTIAMATAVGFICILIHRMTDRPIPLVLMGLIPLPLAFAISILSTNAVGDNFPSPPVLYPSAPKLALVAVLITAVSIVLYRLWIKLEQKKNALEISAIVFCLGTWFTLSYATHGAAMMFHCMCENIRHHQAQLISLAYIVPMFALSWVLIVTIYKEKYTRARQPRS
jgi:hypothetical protein